MSLAEETKLRITTGTFMHHEDLGFVYVSKIRCSVGREGPFNAKATLVIVNPVGVSSMEVPCDSAQEPPTWEPVFDMITESSEQHKWRKVEVEEILCKVNK